MPVSAEVTQYKEKDVIVLKSGEYYAMIAPFMGSNLLRMRSEEKDIEIFRFDDKLSIDELKAESVLYGMPTLFYGNRLGKGVLKASDYTYQFTPNDAEGNYLHGFLHMREHEIVGVETDGTKAIGKTRYIYDEKDPMFETFPVKFTADFTFELDEDGMHYAVTITNDSDRQLPYSICNHTCVNAPFTPDGKGLDTRIFGSIGDEKWVLGADCLPTTETLPLDNHDKQYQTGSMVPVKHIINNDIYPMVNADVDGEAFRGVVISDIVSGKEIVYEVCDGFKFWIFWNYEGDKGFICPEPITWMIDASNLPLHNEESGYLELAPGESKTVTEKIFCR
ncbi:MAG: aldose 1-epimerase [Eubacterium sp.]|nr:aldose 1-epimerase [Eubacterium sp.]